MATQQVETERKYEGTALPERLDQVRGVATTARAAPQDLDTVYYDTSDLRLLRHHVTMRRRTGAADRGWHLKLPLDADRRREIQLPAVGGPHDIPTELLAQVTAFTRGAVLAPVAHLRTHRARMLLRDENGEVLAEITEDRVAAHVLDASRLAAAPPHRSPAAAAGGQAVPDSAARPPGGSSTEISRWTEFEVELDHGTAELLERIDAVFADAELTRSPWPSKLARALGPTHLPGPRPSPARPGSGGAVVTDYLRTQHDALLTLDAAVRRAEEDSVHRMRVTVRRLRSLLRAHRKLFERRRAEPLAAELRWLARLLGQARDEEVFGENVVDQLDAVPAPLRRHDLRGRLTEHYAHRYRQAWQQVVLQLDGDRYFALLDALDAFATSPPLRRRAARKAPKYLSDVLRREQQRTVERLDHALRTAPGPARDQALHRARKAAKRARYTAEGAQAVVPRRTAERAAAFSARMKKLHKTLGTHHDAVVLRRELITLSGEGTGDTEHAFAYGVLYERQRRTADACEERLPKLRRRAGRPGLARLT
ncbi:CYTH and CHAD domain-containing protein [Kitasatospora sp. NPDC048722]|uniref:CYTH and CHAD domain-containing protein n=1 Tax=Kitasatospora sp. NPDC048722 TaxID=3155639 RepID=UPI0033C24911